MFMGRFLLIVFVDSGAEAQTFRCISWAISAGIMNCGEPAVKESHEDETIEAIDADPRRKVMVTIDERTYDQGPDAFIQILKFTNGKLVYIREAGYGSANHRTSDSRCYGQYPDLGATKAEMRMNCGDRL